ncbi:MAG: CMP-N-acetylneuraminate monooxygenase [Parasphingorhabdus sp.]|jgi:CMP-N-acetylneuraminate monooxygenase
MLKQVGYLNTLTRSEEDHVVNLSKLSPGAHCSEHVIFHLNQDRNVDWVVSRICDHREGKLHLRENNTLAICPLHGWRLDLSTLKYSNVNVTKKKLSFKQDQDKLSISIRDLQLTTPTEFKSTRSVEVQVRFIAHACISITIGSVKIITDPWLVGPCFATGWWHKFPPAEDAIDELQSADIIYISHNHPDHMHIETLSHVARDALIITPDFESGSVERLLRKAGFTNIHPLSFNSIHSINNQTDVVLSILKSGDFRDDSGLYLQAGDFCAVLTVDSSALNNYTLPQDIDLLMTSFAGGSYGFPLCFELYPIQKRRQMARQKAMANANQACRYVEIVKPKIYVPYAGFFTEAANRDSFIRENTAKNLPSDIDKMLQKRQLDTRVVNPIEHDSLNFKGGQCEIKSTKKSPLFEVNQQYINHYIDELRKETESYDIEIVSNFFQESEFTDSMILYLVPTNDDFEPIASGLVIDFSTSIISTNNLSGEDVLTAFEEIAPGNNTRHLLLKVRCDSLWHVLKNNLPFEDLLIGFQCRVNRKPDVYNSDFWFHFTNVFIGKTEPV